MHHIYGIHAVITALSMRPHQIKQLFIAQSRDDNKIHQIQQLAQKANIKIQRASKRDLQQYVGEVNHQGVVAMIHAVISYDETELLTLITELNHPALLLILDGVQDPRNLGACLRTANASGVDAVIIPKNRATSITPVVCKVASGAVETTPIAEVTNLARVMEKLQQQGIWLHGLAEQAVETIYAADFTGPVALVLGNEGQGMRRLTREKCDAIWQIPMCGQVSSLNVAVATGVSLFEALRQRQA
ncbi:MAG: 23S rRNA (guanosine(2251)-2'-O)-methyltransferase RlmB [Gammaproteobacteria bacterium]